MIALILGSLIALMALDVWAQDLSSPAEKDTAATHFLQRGWYAERGVELPRPFGIGVNAIFMKRDLMAEVGSNFDDARMLVLSATFRF